MDNHLRKFGEQFYLLDCFKSMAKVALNPIPVYSCEVNTYLF